MSTSLLSLGGLSVELETLDDPQRYFFGFAIADIHVSISRIQARDLRQIETQRHDVLPLLFLDEFSDGSPFQTAPLVLAVVTAEKNHNQFAVFHVELRQVHIEIEARQLRFMKAITEDSLPCADLASAGAIRM